MDSTFIREMRVHLFNEIHAHLGWHKIKVLKFIKKPIGMFINSFFASYKISSKYLIHNIVLKKIQEMNEL